MPDLCKNGRPGGRPSVFHSTLSFVLNEAIAAIGSLVHDCKRAVIILIAEREERMLQQIHLEDGFLTGHRLHVELLGSHKLECALFGFLRCERSFVRSADERVLTQAAGQTGLVLADLALDGRHGRVDRRAYFVS